MTCVYFFSKICTAVANLRAEDLPNLRLAFPAGQCTTMQFHEFLRAFDSFFLGFEIENREAADDFLGFREWAVVVFSSPRSLRMCVLAAVGASHQRQPWCGPGSPLR